jgi:HipA-like protein
VTTPTKIKHLVVGTPQGVAGDLRGEARYAFNYSAHESQCEISLAMPLRAESYVSGALLAIFEMNRPEGYLLYKIEEAFAKSGGLDEMRLLDIVGASLNLRKSRSYPDLDTLFGFGRDVCGVARPEAVVERIAEALSATLKENRGRVAQELWRGLSVEWGVPGKH